MSDEERTLASLGGRAAQNEEEDSTSSTSARRDEVQLPPPLHVFPEAVNAILERDNENVVVDDLRTLFSEMIVYV